MNEFGSMADRLSAEAKDRVTVQYLELWIKKPCKERETCTFQFATSSAFRRALWVVENVDGWILEVKVYDLFMTIVKAKTGELPLKSVLYASAAIKQGWGVRE